MGRLIRIKLGLLGAFALAGCVVTDENVAGSEQALAEEGPWSIPPETLAAGDDDYVVYTGAGLWNDGQDCSGGLEPGAGIVRSYLLAHFPQVLSIGGYSCRRNTGNTAYMSIHAVGRALDIMLPLSGGDADNDLGDPIGEWLIENAETIGIQYIIWDEWTWMAARASGQKGKLYTGPNPHHDHLHVELSAAAGERTVDWFSGLVEPPAIESCDPLPAHGGVIDDLDPCFQSFGPAQYWRVELDTGYGGSLLWTNAWVNPTPSNYARWNAPLTEAGDYEVEVFLTAPFAVYAETRYAVRHAGVEETVYVNQAAEATSEGAWVSLGVYAFASGDDQWVSVYDNVLTTVASEQHVEVDAVRLTRIGVDPPDEGPIDEPTPMVPGEPDPDVDPVAEGAGGGCATSAGGQGGAAWMLMLVAMLVVRRRRA